MERSCLRSPMSKFFRFSESLGKTNRKKWSQIWIFCAHKGWKITAKKIFRLSTNFVLLAGFFWYWCYYPHWSGDALSPECGIFPHNFGTQFFTLFVHQIFALNLFKLLSKPFFHKIILQICHPTIQPIFSTHLHQFFTLTFPKKSFS